MNIHGILKYQTEVWNTKCCLVVELGFKCLYNFIYTYNNTYFSEIKIA